MWFGCLHEMLNRLDGKGLFASSLPFPHLVIFGCESSFCPFPLHSLGGGQSHGLALSMVLTECFSAVPKATDFMSDCEMHSLINMSASGDWQHSFWKRKHRTYRVIGSTDLSALATFKISFGKSSFA